MPNEKQVKQGEIKSTSSTAGQQTTVTGRTPSQPELQNLPVVEANRLLQGTDATNAKPLPAALVQLDYARLENVLIVAAVTMGYMANGGRPNTPAKVDELKALIRNVKELL